jgi:hypothetical protein
VSMNNDRALVTGLGTTTPLGGDGCGGHNASLVFAPAA